MRGAIVLVALAAVAAVAAWWTFRDADPEVPLGPATGVTNDPRAAAPAAAGGAAGAGGLGAGVVATRAAIEPPPAPPLADAPTACLRVVDRDRQQPVVGAPVRRVQDGSTIVFTDERGLAAVPLREPEQLAVAVDGYLMRLVPTRLGTTEAEPQLVTLVRDDWSVVRRFEFTTAGGNPPGDVFVRFRPRAGGKPAPPPVPRDDEVAQRAWSEHTMLAGQPAGADVPVQLGAWNEDRVHRFGSSADVRFTAPGEFALEAATTAGLVARLDVRVATPPRTGAPAIRVRLEPGVFVRGLVVDVRGPALAGAKVTLQGGDPLALVATSGADGAFELGPLWPHHGATLHVRHPDCTPRTHGPIEVPSSGSTVVLEPLPATTIRGRVLARPAGTPIANATVAWHPAAGGPVATTTAADGTFTLRATGTADSRLAVQALGYVPYAEIVAPGTAFADYALWPAVTADRLALGLSAVLEGIVVDAQGQPVPDTNVRWQPDERAPAAATPNAAARRVLEGGVIELPLGARTGADGAFRLETNAFGPGRLTLADGTSSVDATATAGRTVNGLRLQR